jgi:tetratricopeptide (TPR) repeat protein
MTPEYRRMILGGELTPVSQLSGAFLAPPSQMHLQFAYFQSSLVVEFLLGKFGRPALRAVLVSLGEGEHIHRALEEHTLPMPELDRQFEEFAQARARELGPGLDWEQPEEKVAQRPQPSREEGANQRPQRWIGGGDLDLDEWAQHRPTNYWALSRVAANHIREERYDEARTVLERFTSLYPNAAGADSPWRQLALVYRELGKEELEWAVLQRIAEQDAEAPEIYLRLMEQARRRSDWEAVKLNAERHLAVNPLIPTPYRFLAEAGEQTQDLSPAIGAYRALLELNPPDPADTHYRLARALHRVGDPQARRHVLLALEEAPRFREALKLLLEIERAATQPSMSAVQPPRP